MDEQILEMIAYCGLVCTDCLRYQGELTSAARNLITELEKRKFHHYAEVKMKYDTAFENYPIFLDVLRKIVELECQQPCRKGGGCSTVDCKIYKCCIERQYEGCWECENLNTCKEFDFLIPFHGDTPKNNCKKIQKNGFDDFASKKGAFYLW